MSNYSIKKLSLFAITWPIFVESALQMFLRTADTFMLSKVSDEAVAAVGVSNQIVMFAFFLFNFIAVGAAVVVTQYLGAHKHEEVGSLTGSSLAINTIFGFMISLIMLVFSDQLLGMFGLDEELLTLAKSYLFITGGALIVQAITITVVAIIQSHGFTKHTMWVSIGINVLHLFGNYAFIYGAFGFPKLGVTGVAISTVVCQCIGLAINLLILAKIVRVQVTWKSMVRWNREHVMKVLKVGVPSSAAQLSYQASQIAVTAFIASLGAELLTTRIYTQNVMFFVTVLAISLGRGVQIIVGHLVGAGEKDEAYKQVFLNLGRSMIITLSAVALISLFRKQLLGLFTTDADIISLGSTLLLLGFLLEPGRNFNIFIERSLTAAGDARFPMYVSVITMWCFSVPLIYLLGIHLHFGLLGIWTAFIIDEWLRGIILSTRWKSRLWEKKVLVQKDIGKRPKAAIGG